MKAWMKQALPSPVVAALRKPHQYGLRLSYWANVAHGVRGDGPAEAAKLWGSILAGPVTSASRLDRWGYPQPLFDTKVRVGRSRFLCRAATDQLFQVTPAAQRNVLRAIQQHLGPGGTFIDAGANIGFFTVTGARLVGPAGRVVSVEMMADTAAALREHVRMNGLTNVTIVENALSDRTGDTLTARQPVGSGGQASVSRPDFHGTKFVEQTVTTVTLDEAARDLGPVDLIKIDVEGHEAAAFRGAADVLRRTRAVVFECWEDAARQEDAIGVLMAAGFTIRSLDRFNMIAERPGSSATTA